VPTYVLEFVRFRDRPEQDDLIAIFGEVHADLAAARASAHKHCTWRFLRDLRVTGFRVRDPVGRMLARAGVNWDWLGFVEAEADNSRRSGRTSSVVGRAGLPRFADEPAE